MRLPNKTTSYDRSVMPYFPRIAAELAGTDVEPIRLYEAIRLPDKSVGDYLDALDCLFALGRIEIAEGGLLHYVG